MSFQLPYRYIPQKGLQNLQSYKYKSNDRSIFANYVMQPFWNTTIEFIPEWLAPNLITLLGFFFILLSYFTTLYYAPTLTESLPGWVYLLNALCLFLYQTFDAWDGKQARRTRSSSPLGELFDHGCDAMTSVFLALVTGAALKVGAGTLMYVNVIVLMVTFFFTQWDNYFNGILDLWYVNVTEAQFFGMSIQLIAYFCGADFWLKTVEISGSSVPYGYFMLIPSTLTCIGFAISSIQNVLLYTSANNLSISIPMSYVFPCAFVSVFYSIWCYNSYHLLQNHVHPFCVCLGFIYCNLVGRLVTSRVCKLPFDIFYVVFVPLPFAVLNSFLKGQLMAEDKVVYLYCAFSIFCYLHFCISLIVEFTNFLNIHCFTIPYPPPPLPSDPAAQPVVEKPNVTATSSSTAQAGTPLSRSAKKKKAD